MPALSQSALEVSRQRADALIAAEKLVCIDAAAFQELARDQNRTLYLVDVRSLTEFKAGHLPHAVHAWSGQIAQAADLTIGVRRARVVLSDDTGMRAAIAAIWLRALDYEVYIIRETNSGALPSDWRKNAPARSPVDLLKPIPVSSAIAQISGGGVRVIDIRNSQAFRRAHIPGALWANRARLGVIPNDYPLILCADDALAAAYLARDLRSRGATINGLLEGGLAAWQSAGQPIAASPDHPADGECIDFLFFVHDRHDGNLDSARRYLEWETGLIAQLDPEEQQSFRLA
jgi:rhodanese-related sulfurtransferase